jgi:hypothetical protein
VSTAEQLTPVEPDDRGDPPTAWDHELADQIGRDYADKARVLNSYLLGCVADARRNLGGTRESPRELQRAITESALDMAQTKFDVDQASYSLRDVEGVPSSFMDDPEGRVLDARDDLAGEMGRRLDEVTTEAIVERVVAHARRAARFETKLAEARLADEVKRARQIERASSVTRREGVLLSALSKEPRSPARFRIEGLLRTSGRVILAAQYKAGKTTIVGNLVRSLVNGEPFLGQFSVTPVLGRVTLLDTEMGRDTLRDWLEDQDVERPERVAIFPLRGEVSGLDIMNPEGLKEWAKQLRALETEVLVLDCLRPVLDALGLNENTDAGALLGALDELIARAGIAELIVVHHMGHNGERSRGSSRLRDWPDVEWRLVREDIDDPASRRYFSAFGRDVEVPESALDFDRASRHLTVAGTGSRKTARADAEVARVIELLTAQPGLSGRAIERELSTQGVAVKVTQEALKRAVEGGRVAWTRDGRAYRYRVVEDASKIDSSSAENVSKINHNILTSGNVCIPCVDLPLPDDHGFRDHPEGVVKHAQSIEIPGQPKYASHDSVCVNVSPEASMRYASVLREADATKHAPDSSDVESGKDVEVRRSRRKTTNPYAPEVTR